MFVTPAFFEKTLPQFLQTRNSLSITIASMLSSKLLRYCKKSIMNSVLSDAKNFDFKKSNMEVMIWFIYNKKETVNMVRRRLTEEEKEEQKKEQKMRADASRAARRSGKPIKKEGKVSKARAKTKEPRSQKKVATVNKSRY